MCVLLLELKKNRALWDVFFKETRLCSRGVFLKPLSTVSLPSNTADLLTTPDFSKCTAHRRRLFSGDCPPLNSNSLFYLRRLSRSSLGAIKKTPGGILAPVRIPTLHWPILPGRTRNYLQTLQQPYK